MDEHSMLEGVRERICEHLQYRCLNLSQFADICGINRSTLGQIMNHGVAMPKTYTVWKIAQGMRCTVSYLLTGSTNERYQKP